MPRYLETRDDLNRKYQGTFAKYRNELVYIDGFDNGADNAVHILYRQNPRQGAKGDIFDEQQLVDVMPDIQYFNKTDFKKKPTHEGGVCFAFYRYPRKQFQRSVSKSNSYCSSPLANLYGLFGIPSQTQLDPSLELIQALFNTTYPELSWALDNLPSFRSIAISERYAIVPSPFHTTKTALLCSHTSGIVGTMDQQAINLFHAIEEQEVTDYLRNAKLQLSMTICPIPS